MFDDTLLAEASVKIPQLHQKYVTLLSEYLLLKKKKEQELKGLQHRRFLYYAGKAQPEEYEDQPFNYKLMKSEIPSWVEVDEMIQKVDLKLEYYCVTIRCLEDILKQIHQMSFNIKNMIEWRRFVHGT